MKLEEKLVAYIVGAKFEDLPKEDVDVAKNMVLTEMGAIIAGATAEGCQTLVNLIKEWGGKRRQPFSYMEVRYRHIMLLLPIALWPVPWISMIQ